MSGRRAPGPCYPEWIWPTEFFTARSGCVISFRERHSLDAFVDFTFCTKTPAAYHLASGYNDTARTPNRDLIYLRATPRRLLEAMVPLATVDRLPLKRDAVFSAGIAAPVALDWHLSQSGTIRDDANDPTRSARIAAELLAYSAVPLRAFDAIVRWDEGASIQATVEEDAVGDLAVRTDRTHFFARGV